MTKPVTAILTLKLIEEGILSLDDEISKYLPELSHLSVYEGVEDAEEVVEEDIEEVETEEEGLEEVVEGKKKVSVSVDVDVCLCV
jgi:CubicO group peptidase (beta-lactamase class C family)